MEYIKACWTPCKIVVRPFAVHIVNVYLVSSLLNLFRRFVGVGFLFMNQMKIGGRSIIFPTLGIGCGPEEHWKYRAKCCKISKIDISLACANLQVFCILYSISFALRSEFFTAFEPNVDIWSFPRYIWTVESNCLIDLQYILPVRLLRFYHWIFCTRPHGGYIYNNWF